MKKDIHPTYKQITIKCACGNTAQVGSTSPTDIEVEICASCHPFYTGKAKLVDTARRIDKFEARLKKTEEMKNAVKSKIKVKIEETQVDTKS